MNRTAWIAILLFGFSLIVNGAGVRILQVAGGSMSPSIRSGDLVITSNLLERGEVGSIVLLKRPSDGQLLLHRVIERGAGWRRTKGDASLSPDGERFPDEAVLGGLAAVIPAGLLIDLPFNLVAAQFNTTQQIGVNLTTSAGAQYSMSGPLLSGADALGRLLPGGRATWTFTLTPCSMGLGGECAGSINTLRIDPDRFTPLSGGALARSLRLAMMCRAVGTQTWADTADLFTAPWSATSPSTGRLASLASGASPIECQLQVTALGSIAASEGALALPLRWGPE